MTFINRSSLLTKAVNIVADNQSGGMIALEITLIYTRRTKHKNVNIIAYKW